jgi:hypothetical protein
MQPLKSSMKVLGLSGYLLLIAAASASWACTKHAPCPVIAFNPAMPSELDNTPVGSVLSSITVTLNPASAGQFTGRITFTSPYGNDSGLMAISGHDVVLAKPFPIGSSTHYVTILATQ